MDGKKQNLTIVKNKSLLLIITIVPLLLLIPWIAMQFSNEVNWTSLDFVVMGFLLLGTGLLCDFILRKVTKVKHRIIACILLLLCLLLVWAELAVGIFGSPFAGN